MAQFLIALDYSIIYVALPSIASDLRLAPSLAQWVISAYALLFAGFLVVGGRLADRLGASRLFVVAITTFGMASAIGGAAGDAGVLLAARGLQGLAAAMLQPAVLGLIGTTFPPGPSRARAIAVWGSVGASGLAAGAILGGLLTTASWRLTFLINVPLTVLCAVGAAVWMRSASGRTSGRIPAVAASLATVAVLALVLGLTLASEQGWASISTAVCLGIALVLILAFFRNENRSANALIDPSLRRLRSLRIGAVATALYMASVGSEFYLLTLLLQSMKGYAALQAGLAFLPLAITVTIGNVVAGRVMRRLTPAGVLMGGFGVAAAGLLWLSFTLHGDSYVADLLPGVILSGLGHGAIYTSMFTIGTGDVPAGHQGTAGALLTTSQYLSGAVTVVVLTLALGAAPHEVDFRVAFLITFTAAALGTLVGALAGRRAPTGPSALPLPNRLPRTPAAVEQPCPCGVN